MDGLGGLGWGMLGLGVGSDIFNAYSQQQAAQRQRQLLAKQLEIQTILRDPNQVLAGAQPYYQANIGAMQAQLPQFMRSTINPMLGVQGLDPSGGNAQFITQQAIAPQIANAQQNSVQQYINALTGGQQGLNYAANVTGMPAGGGGGTADALKWLAMMSAMRGGANNPQGMADTQGLSTPGTSWSSLNPAYMNYNPNFNYGIGASQIDPNSGY